MEEKNYEDLILREDEMTDEEWDAAYDEFYERYPDCPVAEPIECLDLIMRREFAEMILRGEKKVEFRDFSDHYANRLCDKEVRKYIDTKQDDDDFMVEVGNFVSSMRPVKKIHFHNYNNTWFLDVSVTLNDVISCSDSDIEFLHEEFDCYELDEDNEYYGEQEDEEMPEWFYFVMGEVLDTNLTVSK